MNGFEMYRRLARLTQAQAAERFGVSEAAISLWENGKSFPRGYKLAAIAKAYGCTISDLFKEGI